VTERKYTIQLTDNKEEKMQRNPVAKAVRRIRPQAVKAKKGRGSYFRIKRGRLDQAALSLRAGKRALSNLCDIG
jgi:hypothetical protein